MATTYRCIYIAGTYNGFYSLNLYEAKILPGAGGIIATALKRESKNRYKVVVILKTDVFIHNHESFNQAVDDLQEIYNKYGTLTA